MVKQTSAAKSRNQAIISIALIIFFVAATGAVAYYGGLLDRFHLPGRNGTPPLTSQANAPRIPTPEITAQEYNAPMPQVTAAPDEMQFNAVCRFPDGRVVAGRVNVRKGTNPSSLQQIDVRVPGLSMRVKLSEARCGFTPL